MAMSGRGGVVLAEAAASLPGSEGPLAARLVSA